MAEVKLKLKVEGDKEVTKSLNGIEQQLTEMKTELKGLDIGSARFKELSRDIKSTESQFKNLNKSIEGLDTEAVAGEMGKLAGGIGAAFAGITVIAGDAGANFEEMAVKVGKFIVIGNAVKGMTEVWTSAQKLLNIAMAKNPVMIVVAGVAALVAGVTVLISKWDEWFGTNKKVNVEMENKQELLKKNIAFQQSMAKESVKEVSNVKKIFDLLKSENSTRETKNKLIKQLLTSYPTLLKFKLSDKSTQEELNKAELAANSIIEANIALKQYETEKEQILLNKINKRIPILERLKQLGVEQNEIDALKLKNSSDLVFEMNKISGGNIDVIDELLKLNKLYKFSDEQLSDLNDTYAPYLKIIDELSKSQDDLNKVQENNINNLNEQKEYTDKLKKSEKELHEQQKKYFKENLLLTTVKDLREAEKTLREDIVESVSMFGKELKSDDISTGLVKAIFDNKADMFIDDILKKYPNLTKQQLEFLDATKKAASTYNDVIKKRDVITEEIVKMNNEQFTTKEQFYDLEKNINEASEKGLLTEEDKNVAITQNNIDMKKYLSIIIKQNILDAKNNTTIGQIKKSIEDITKTRKDLQNLTPDEKTLLGVTDKEISAMDLELKNLINTLNFELAVETKGSIFDALGISDLSVERAQEVVGQIADTIGTLTDISDVAHDKKMQQLEDEKDMSLGVIDSRAKAISDLEKREQYLIYEKALINNKFESDKYAAQERYAKRAKRLAIAEASSQAALSILQLWTEKSALPFPASVIAKGIASVAVAAQAATQVASVKSQNFADGGLITGAGTGTSDSINANVSNGEYIINANATKMFFPLIESINSIKNPTGFNKIFDNNTQQQPQKVYVTEADISKTQKNLRNISVESTF